MASEDTERRLRDLIADKLRVNPADVKPSASFIDDLGADSLDIVELVYAIENEFELQIPDEDAERIQTVQDALLYITDKGR